MKNLSNRGKLLIAFALIVVIAVAAIIAGNLNRRDNGPAALTPPVNVTVSMRLNEQGINDLLPQNADLADESFRKTFNAVTALVNNATIGITVDDNAGRMDLRLKDQDILYVAMKLADDAMRMKTDFFPEDSVILMTKEDMNYTGEMPSFPSAAAEDIQLFREAQDQFSRDLRAHLKEKCGDEEKGSWEFEGKTFTSRRPVSLTLKELLTLVLSDYRDMLQAEKLASYYKKAGLENPGETIGKYIEQVSATPDEKFPEMTLYISEAGNDIYCAADLADRDASGHIDCGMVGTVIAGHGTISGETNAQFDLTADNRGYNYDLAASIDAPAGRSGSGERMVIGLKAAGTTEKTGEGKGTISVSASGSELFAADYTIGKGEKISLDFDGENQRVITISDLNNSGRTEEGKKLSMEIASGVLRIFQRISAAMPDEVNQLMTLMTLVQ